MKVAIHNEPGTFSDRWTSYCRSNGIPYFAVDCYATNIIEQLNGADRLLWHWSLSDRGSRLHAKQLTRAIEAMGIQVFPNTETSWHYDDKIAQKYLFEALKLPVVPTYVFYDRESARTWAGTAIFPKVFKLRGGAGSVNVRLVKGRKEAIRLIDQAFRKGFPVLDRKAILRDRIRSVRRERSFAAVGRLAGSAARIIVPSERERLSPRELSYVYFQDFIPGNTYDTRLVVIGNRCIGFRRYCREGDFRASGSGSVSYDKQHLPKSLVALAFKLADQLKMQSVAFDFVKDQNGFLLVEVSYCFSMGSFYDNCPGYWDRNLEWICAPVDPQRFIIEDFLGLSDL